MCHIDTPKAINISESERSAFLSRTSHITMCGKHPPGKDMRRRHPAYCEAPDFHRFGGIRPAAQSRSWARQNITSQKLAESVNP